MSVSAASTTLARAARSLPGPANLTESDGALLARFVRSRDEDAFETLVRRLGPMVLEVCRRHIGDGHLAEDAFQAVFLVLARRASDVRPREGIRGWVYGVAVRAAKGARAMSARRRSREVSVATVPDRPAPADMKPDAEVIAIIDEEIAALPEHLRTAVVLCEMEGCGRKEVAGRLRIAEGTLSSRRAAARKQLARRLRQRGVALSAEAIAAVIAGPASAHVPSALTVKAVMAATGNVVPTPVAVLSHGVLRLMFLNKLKLAIPLSLAAVGLPACATVFAQPAVDPPAVSVAPKMPPVFTVRYTQTPAKAEPKPLPKGPNKLLIRRSSYLTLIDPDGKNEQKLTENQDKAFNGGHPSLSPDGKKVAFVVQTEAATETSPAKLYLHVRGLTGNEPDLDLETTAFLYAWSPDGTKIAVSDFVTAAADQIPKIASHIVDVTSKEKKPLKLPDNHLITDWTRDGKHLLTVSLELVDKKPSTRLHLMHLDGTEYKQLTDAKETPMFARVSPDGKRVLFGARQPPREKDANPGFEMKVLEIDSGKVTPLAEVPLNGEIQGFCWSPDSKRIAYSWREIHQGKPEDLINKETESHLVICDPDGKNQKTIVSEKAQGQWILGIGEVDWR